MYLDSGADAEKLGGAGRAVAIIKAVNSRASIAHAIRYITRKEKTEKKLIGGFNCIPRYALEDMKRTKKVWGKTDGRQYKHFIQSFPPEEKITLETANEIAGKLVEESSLFQGYEVCYATHRDREHIHTHIIVNSVSFEDGKKFRYSKRQLQDLKDLSDQVLKRYGFSVCKKNQEITSYEGKTYQKIVKAAEGKEESWLLNMALIINNAKKKARSKKEFTETLDRQGISVSWTEKKKYILFQDQEGHKARNKKIEEIFKTELGKEKLLDEFTANRNRENKSWQINRQHGTDESRRTNGTIPSGIDGRCKTECNRTGEYQIERAVAEIERELGQLEGNGREVNESDQRRTESADRGNRREKRRAVPGTGSSIDASLRKADNQNRAIDTENGERKPENIDKRQRSR